MIYITAHGMNNLLAYGAPDGVYNTIDHYMGKSDMHIIAIVKHGKVKVNGFKYMEDAKGWIEKNK